MPDLILIISRWWKAILAIVGLVTAVALLILLVQPKQYLSTVTALPASSYASDKAHIFNDNINQLYPSLGTPDDLDPVIGTSKLDTLYLAVVRERDLRAHYHWTGATPLQLAHVLKNHTKVERSEYNELKVKVWDKDPVMAAELANALFLKLQQLHQSLQSQGNALVLQRLQEQYTQLRNAYTGPDSSALNGSAADLVAIKRKNLQEQIAHYEKLISEYNLVLQTNPQALLAVELARPALKPDKPRVAQVLLLTAFASLVFALLLAVALQSRKE